MWCSGIILRGKKDGRKIGFPTINLDPLIMPKNLKEGVYAAKLKYKNKVYDSALYFGPRLVKKEANRVLEIHIIDFDEEIYGEIIQFQYSTFIRGVLNFKSMEQMKIQIRDDLRKIKTLSKI